MPAGKDPMKHTAAFALTLLLACAPIATQAEAPASSPSAQSEAEESVIMRTVKEANLRSQPGKSAARINTLLKGRKVRLLDVVTAEDDEWAHVRVVSTGQEGYVLLSLLEAEPEETPTPKPTATPRPTPTATPDGPKEETFDEPMLVRTGVRANLRKTPGGTRLDELARDTYLTVLGQIEDADGALWYHVREKSGREGYMLAELLVQIAPAKLLPVSESEVRERFPVLSCDPIRDAREAAVPAYSSEELAKYPTLTVGTRSDAVLRLKQRLYDMGYFSKPNENKNYTESTADVVGKFQEDIGLPVTGIADPLTQAALFDEDTPKREGSPQEVKYLQNADMPLAIQRTDVTSYSFHGSIQLSLRNNSGSKLTAFGLKIIPYMRDGSAADMADTFAEEIEREYSVSSIAIADGRSYSDFETNDRFDEAIWPHHFQVSNQIYFSGAQVAVCWYKSGGKKVYVDDDQLVFVEAGVGAGDSFIHTLPVTLTAQETANASWELGIVTRYVLPVYQAHYGLPQGAWIKEIEAGSPAADAGLEAGDVIVGIGDVTILGDATLRKARGQIAPGESATLVFWRAGSYYQTELLRPKAE